MLDRSELQTKKAAAAQARRSQKKQITRKDD
jgi:hypothetical protein